MMEEQEEEEEEEVEDLASGGPARLVPPRHSSIASRSDLQVFDISKTMTMRAPHSIVRVAHPVPPP